METLVGRSINEYRVVEHLGEGGMGEVYRAVHARLGRTVALKVLKHMDSDCAAKERFMNEARIQAALSHPNIAVLYELCETGGCPCIIMEFVDGKTLSELLQANGRFPAGEALRIFGKIVHAIGYIHDRGIIHRDIKPNNVKVDSRGEVKLLDFGISKASFSENLTRQGTFIGTEQYLSPELLQGKPASVQSDIWALGALLYEMVTGRAAFEATSIGELYRKITELSFEPPSSLVPSIPQRLEAIISRCLRKTPANRYPSARTLLEDVEDLADSDDQLNDKASFLTGFAARFAIVGKYWVVFPVLLLLAAGAGLIAWMGPDPTPPPTTTTTTIGPSPPGPYAVNPEPDSENHAPPQSLCTISIAVFNSGEARLYLGPGDRHRGPYEVPHTFSVPVGSRVHYLLKLPGYQDRKGSFNVERDQVFTFTLCKQSEFCGPED